MDISIAEVKRRLPVGARYKGENLAALRPENRGPFTRRVLTQASDMVSVYLDGPKEGQKIYLGKWRGVEAREEDDAIILTSVHSKDGAFDFLRITDIQAP